MTRMTRRNMMTEDEIIIECQKYVTSLLSKESTGHDIEHCRRVMNTAFEIQKVEGGDKFKIALISLLHDVDDYKLFPMNKNNENARYFLNTISIDADPIVNEINMISFKGNETVSPLTLEGKIVQDADRIDALGAIGVARAFAYGGKHNRKMYDESVKPNINQDFETYKNSDSTTINHFYEKLLLLENMMNTEKGKEIAHKRTEYMKAFLKEFLDEWNSLD